MAQLVFQLARDGRNAGKTSPAAKTAFARGPEMM